MIRLGPTARHALAATAVLAGALALTACADGDSGTVAPATPEPGASAPISGSQVTSAPSQNAEPTCDTILPSDTVEDFVDAGWAARQDPFYVGNIELSDGIQCTWGDPKVASDQVQVYGWAPLSAQQSDEITTELIDSGWEKIDGDGVVYLTAPEEMIMSRDEDGYGMTYRLSDHDIAVSDTKQGLLLVEWPPS
ncbi:hypothetical protein ET475_14520 [Microbacterium protaetiae]|uniref:Nitrate ABC transporter substrate-binding protein n=1 Tax=Microbacterium protaetiae TaxID=2509458 RepID=A0A4P6EII8_9MICO|nr:hypothetical protein [Microbacterium protaetiae]QAY61079.1 hypothetical protein ET475_14520 [Microbacterium protaetiae]